MITRSHAAFDLNHPFTGIAQRWNRPRRIQVTALPRPEAAIVVLNSGETHALTSFNGGSIECTEGCVWLTHDGDCRDVVLEAGHAHVADRDSRLLIHALATSAICFIRPS